MIDRQFAAIFRPSKTGLWLLQNSLQRKNRRVKQLFVTTRPAAPFAEDSQAHPPGPSSDSSPLLDKGEDFHRAFMSRLVPHQQRAQSGTVESGSVITQHTGNERAPCHAGRICAWLSLNRDPARCSLPNSRADRLRSRRIHSLQTPSSQKVLRVDEAHHGRALAISLAKNSRASILSRWPKNSSARPYSLPLLPLFTSG